VGGTLPVRVADPQIHRAILVIADIGGYTRFMTLTRFNLAHAQRMVAELLEAVIDAAGPLKLSKLEGDAALFWAPSHDTAKDVARCSQALVEIRAAFLARRSQLIADRMCDCESCQQLEKLSIKFVAHEGEVAMQKVKRHTELAGVDVILVHRMLKNDVPVSEYVLMTERVHGALPEPMRPHARELKHDFEGIGEVKTHYLDFRDLGELPPPHPVQSPARKFWEKVKLETLALPYVLGLKKPLQGYDKTLKAITPAAANGP
jgi:hypothetical protein